MSTFDTDAEGWRIVGDAQEGSADPAFNAEGGNPGGYIDATDDVAGGTWYFRAPASWAGDASAAYGGTLEFDLFVTDIASPFSEPDVILEGGGLSLTFDVPSDPGTAWTHFSVPLTESAGWIDSATGAAPTADQFRSVLASLSGLEIRGEYNTGPDTGSLDNVRLA